MRENTWPRELQKSRVNGLTVAFLADDEQTRLKVFAFDEKRRAGYVEWLFFDQRDQRIIDLDYFINVSFYNFFVFFFCFLLRFLIFQKTNPYFLFSVGIGEHEM